ncbi:MAG: glycosyltransferase family 4 protein [Candidatus Woesearchaeota archaeon]
MKKNFFILTQSYSENKGSYLNYFENLAKEAYKRNYNVIILSRKNFNEEDYEKLSYCEVYRFPNYNFKVFNMIFNEIIFSFHIKNFFKKYKNKYNIKDSDVIIANGYTPLGILDKKYILRVPDQPGKTILKNLSLYRMPFFNSLFQKIHFNICAFWDKIIISKANKLIFSSEANMNEFKKYFTFEKNYFIPNKAIDNSFLDEKKNKTEKKAIKELKKLYPGKNILFIARSDERIRKGIYYFEKVLEKLFEKYNDLNLIHVGDKINWHISEKYKNRIKEVGFVSLNEMPKYYKIADVFVITSISEGIPAVLIEAMASGSCIISSDLIGINEYIENNKSGLIFTRGNEKELLEKIDFLLINKKIAKKLGNNAKIKIKELKNYFDYFFDFINANKNFNLLK